MTFLAVTAVFYERGGKTFLLQHVHIIRADSPDQAVDHVREWVTTSYPEPAYFSHEWEVHDLPDVVMQGENAALEFAVSETPITITQSKET